MSMKVEKIVCVVCDKRAYPMDSTTFETKVYHTACMKCAHCHNTVTPGKCAAFDGILYCKPHFKQLFKARGKYDDLSPRLSTAPGSSLEAEAAAEEAKASPEPAVAAPDS